MYWWLHGYYMAKLSLTEFSHQLRSPFFGGKVTLLDALNGRGKFGKAVRAHQPVCPFLQTQTQDSRVVHIRPWNKCTDKERLDPDNGILLGAEYADYFTNGYISFDENGRYYFSCTLDPDTRSGFRGGEEDFALVSVNSAQHAYLEYHRTHVFENWRIEDGMVLIDLPTNSLETEPPWIPDPSGEWQIFKQARAQFVKGRSKSK